MPKKTLSTGVRTCIVSLAGKISSGDAPLLQPLPAVMFCKLPFTHVLRHNPLRLLRVRLPTVGGLWTHTAGAIYVRL